MSSAQTYDLPAKATISECANILTSLRKLIEENHDITVDSNAVEQIDLAMLQVLISAGKTAQRDNKSFSLISKENGTLDAALTEYGICFSRTPDPI
ncbi:STAS domain-containing protein [Marivita sp.]|jgi:ABC-type transporter Mla MlaB component|uniref:STAS domain-containing protein n=1 Tax=Marivita sp. TaxID=2003365 RepID=UPI00321AE9E5